MDPQWQQVIDDVIGRLHRLVSDLFDEPRDGGLANREAVDDAGGPRLSEHQLITYCADHGAFAGLEHLRGNLGLFYKHFLTMHVLYEVRQQWWNRGLHLRISPLAIDCVTVPAPDRNTQLGEARELVADYYRDLSHLRGITEEQVADLLAGFWTMVAADRDELRARDLLGVDASADWAGIQRAYRRMAATTHPDKGGSESAFVQVQQAFEVLAAKYARRRT